MPDAAKKTDDKTKMTNDHHNEFDRFLNREMSSEEYSAFEDRLISDAVLRKSFDEYRELCGFLRDSGQYATLADNIRSIHREFNPKPQIFILRPKVLWITSAAASVAILLTVLSPYLMNKPEAVAVTDDEYRPLTGAQESATSAGSDDNAESESDDKTLYAQFDREIVDSLISPMFRLPIGTCFMISQKGYFLTSKHLVEDRKIFTAQHRETQQTFEVETVYRDSLLDFAILRCHKNVADLFDAIPYRFYKADLELGEEVFTLGYPKADIVYTKGAVSSETGFLSDSNFVEISLPANPGFSGAPLFTENGDLAGIITANNSKKQNVTYVLKHQYVFGKIAELEAMDSLDVDLSRNYSRRFSQKSNLIKNLRPYIFELH